MPLLRYFLVVGGTLLALLLIVNAALPALPRSENAPSASADLSIIRIHSDKKWPERIVFDTTRPTVTSIAAAPAPLIAHTEPAQKTATAVQPAKPQVREAFAQMRSNANEARSAEPRRKHRTVARSYISQPPSYGGPRSFVVAQQPRFGFFGNNIW